tara:strand:+ start:371 stop:520 length:150 start_codon:yes stop_codon:yes gene_type:complete
MFSDGVGIVVTIHENFAKVYWIYAKSFLWIMVDKLTPFDDLNDLKGEKH